MRRVLVMSLVSAAITALVPATASADVGSAETTPASCMGIEAAAPSPPGSSEEAPGGVPDIKAFVDEAAPGVPPGLAFFSVAGGTRVGSHEACDEVLG